jgi:hypothetical protein
VSLTLTIHGTELPGRRDPHVALQVGREPVGVVPGDATSATWTTELRLVTAADGTTDVRGPAVQGRRGERFVYLTWGDVAADGTFTMVRRAKLMLGPLLAATPGERATVTVRLTDDRGAPRAARVPETHVTWTFS